MLHLRKLENRKNQWWGSKWNRWVATNILLDQYDLFTIYDMEAKTHVHVQIENQLGFHELQIACYSYGLEFMRWS